MYTDVHTYHTYVSGVLSFLFVLCKSSHGCLRFKKNMPKKNWIHIDEKICHNYIRRDNCKMLHWSKTRGTTQHNPSTHESVLGKQTYYYGSKQQQAAVPICGTTILYSGVCTSIILPLLWLYLRRLWMIRDGYMRQHVVHVPTSRNVTTVWMLTWIPNLSL